jgi:hypothetical protein
MKLSPAQPSAHADVAARALRTCRAAPFHTGATVQQRLVVEASRLARTDTNP